MSTRQSSSKQEREPLLKHHDPIFQPSPTGERLYPGDVEANLGGPSEHAGVVEESQKVARTPRNCSTIAVVAVLLVGVFVANLDTSFLFAVHGTIASEFELLSQSSWLVSSYALALCASQPVYGKLSDIYGRKPILLGSYVIFCLGSAICGTAKSFSFLILGRVVSGVGGAGMTALVSIVITDLVDVRNIATWRSFVNIAATIGRGAGGPIGGVLSDTVGWRWSFLGQCPLILVAVVLSVLKVPVGKAANYSGSRLSTLTRVDFVGAGLLALSTLAFLTPLELGGQKLPWSHPAVLGLFGAFLVLVSLFAFCESYWAKEPIFPLKLVGHRDVATSYLIMLFQCAAQTGMVFTVPLYFQVTQAASASSAGTHLIPSFIGNGIGGLFTGYIIKRKGYYKRMIMVSALIASISYTLLVTQWNGKTGLLESLYVFPGGLGTGIAQSALFISLTAELEPFQIAVASSGLYLSMNLGVVIGLAGTSAIMQKILHSALRSGLTGFPNREEIISSALSNVNYVARLDGKLGQIVVNAYVTSLKYAFGVPLCFSAVALVVSFFVVEHKI